MLEMADVVRDVRGFNETKQSALTCSEQRLIQRFRQMTDQEQHQVLRLLEVMNMPPVTTG